ncbi:MAG: hypothetical protein JXM68_12800 [Sedimentisphaerales bacterium]|nr:hypothetical protein [Sedimentisphaerales bacterium]
MSGIGKKGWVLKVKVDKDGVSIKVVTDWYVPDWYYIVVYVFAEGILIRLDIVVL